MAWLIASLIIKAPSTQQGCYPWREDICSVQFSSVAQSCPTLCNPMNHSTPVLPVHCQIKFKIINLYERSENKENLPNSFGLCKEWDGHKKPLLIPWLQFLIAFRQRREAHSGSLCGHHKTVNLKSAQHKSCKLSFVWIKMRTAAQERAPQIALRKCSRAAWWGAIYIYKGYIHIYIHTHIHSRTFLVVTRNSHHPEGL